MDSISKRPKHFKKQRVECNEDMISNLPASLIGHILSFLPTKNAVATSVLSTKWKFLWTSITNLDFDDYSLVVYPRMQNKQEQNLLEMSFINFVYRVLGRAVSDLQKFHLRCVQNYDVSHLSAWVSTAVSRNLRELHLSRVPSLPRELFTCRSLVVLKLQGRFDLNVPTLVCLPSLKILAIEYLTFLDDDSIYRLFSSCPVLEDLSIKECNWRNISVFNISAPLLKRLTIKCKCYRDSDSKFKIVLNTPNLQDLEYRDLLAEGYSLNELNALVKADICLNLLSVDVPDGVGLAISEFIEGISKVKWLFLWGSWMERFELGRLSLPKFDHLTYLEFHAGLDADIFVGCEGLLYFVESSPRLETLIFRGLSHEDGWNPPKQVPSCLLFHLKKIEIKEFQGGDHELEMLEYFLENSRVLKKLTILHHSFHVGMLEICKKVLMLPRGSKTCRVEVVDDL